MSESYVCELLASVLVLEGKPSSKTLSELIKGTGLSRVTVLKYLKYRGLKPAGSSRQSPTSRHDPCGLIDPILLTQFLSNLKDGASLLHEQ
jgi:hypothetical protein